MRALLRGFAPHYRLHRKDVPGNPDIAYIGAKARDLRAWLLLARPRLPRAARACRRPTPTIGAPRSPAIARATRAHQETLAALGWRALVVWECELKDRAALEAKLREFLAAEDERA